MKIYETTFIVNPQADDATIDRQVNAVAEIIQNNNGRIIKSNRIGTRRLAYPIQNLTQGYYADFIFESEPDVLPKIERLFKLEDAYIRHLLIRFDGDPRWLEEEPGEESRERPAAGPEEREESAQSERRPASGGRRPEPAEVRDATRTEAEKKAPAPEEAIPAQPAPVKEPDESIEPEPQTPTADEVPGVPEKKEEASESPTEEKAGAEEEDKEKREKIAGEGDEL